MKRIAWIAFASFLSAPVCMASTFVGNGGGAGDVELSVTKKQIEETFTAIVRHKQDETLALCRCNRAFENRSVCEPLASLTEPQRAYCKKTIQSQAPEVIRLVTDPSVLIRWTHDPINVVHRGSPRAVDAVTDRESRTITVNIERFLEMKPFERVFLLTHEYLHLTKLDGKPMQDTGEVGPYTGEEGGLQLLNVLGASAAVLQGDLPSEIKKYRGRLLRSKSWKRWWFDLGVGSASPEGMGAFALDRYGLVQLGSRYSLGNFVLALNYRVYSETKKVLGSINVDEDVNVLSAGVGYRFFLFDDPHTFWGQSHLLVQGFADYASATLSLDDDFTQSQEKQQVWGASLATSYYIPFFWGLWAYAGLSYEVHPFKYETVNVEYKKGFFSQYTGVAYAF